MEHGNLHIITLTSLLLFSMLIGFVSAYSKEVAYILVILFFAFSGYLFAKGRLPLLGKKYQEYSWQEITVLIVSAVGIIVVMQLLISVLRRLFVS